MVAYESQSVLKNIQIFERSLTNREKHVVTTNNIRTLYVSCILKLPTFETSVVKREFN